MPVKQTNNKKEAFVYFLNNVISKRPRMLKKMLREILPRAIEKRHREGNPVLEVEINNLSNQLFELKIDLRKEIKDLKLPKERPKIVPPPIVSQKILENFSLYPILLPDCQKMFNDGHINESVRKSLERFEKKVQQMSALNNKYGADLMANAFCEDNPRICLNDLKSQDDINEQSGYKFISMGIMKWWRNNLSHGDEPQMPHQEAVGRLILVSNLLARLDGIK